MFLNNKKKRLLLFCTLALALFLFWNTITPVYALEINYPWFPGLKSSELPQKFTKTAIPEEIPGLYIKYFVKLSIFAGIWLSIIILIIGGTRYIFFSAGKPENKISARNQITSAFLGLLILLSSFILLKTINPQLLILSLHKVKPAPSYKQANIPPPPPEKVHSLINVEIPFGNIIKERIFNKNTPKSPADPLPSISKIKSIALANLNIALSIKKTAESLKNKISECSCENTTPIGNYCTCDPCANVRNDIQDLEKENLGLAGIEMKKPSNGGFVKIPPPQENLKFLQGKETEQFQLLKKEIAKLKRTEKIMLNCPLSALESLSAHLSNKDFYQEKKWFLTDVQFWKEIPINTNRDYDTFYCPISGTITEEFSDFSPKKMGKPSGDSTKPPEVSEKTTCTEIPIGKFIDRSKKLANKLTERLEKLIGLNKQMAIAIDHLHYLISLCSSKNCQVVKGANGEEYCRGDPCPNQKILNQVNVINILYEEIEKTVNAPIPQTPHSHLKKEELEQVGIIPIIDDAVLKMLEEFKEKVTDEMEECVSDIPLQSGTEPEAKQSAIVLISCENAVRSLAEGKTIQKCHLELKEFQKCLSHCYLEKSYERYKKCLLECLSKETKLSQEKIKTWYHLMDFFCCGK